MRAAARLGLTVAALAVVMSFSEIAAADSEQTPPPAVAEEPSPSGFRVAIRSGLALPLGEAFYASGALTDTITGYVPIRLDVGYRIQRHFYVGLDVQLASIIPSNCPSGSSCSGTDTRVGFMVAYHLRPARTVDPWLGLGMGYEAMSVSRTVEGTKVDVATRGFELLDVDLGVDVRPTRSLRVGPVVSTSIASFTRVAVNGTATNDFQTSTHAWVMFGLRGAFDL